MADAPVPRSTKPAVHAFDVVSAGDVPKTASENMVRSTASSIALSWRYLRISAALMVPSSSSSPARAAVLGLPEPRAIRGVAALRDDVPCRPSSTAGARLEVAGRQVSPGDAHHYLYSWPVCLMWTSCVKRHTSNFGTVCTWNIDSI